MAWFRSKLKDLSDEDLMHVYQEGNQKAFRMLLGRHSTAILNFIYRFIGNRTLAEDLLQEVFLRVIRSSGSYKRKAKFTTWLYTIARNLCIDTIRKQKHRRTVSLNQPIGSSEEGQPMIDMVKDKSPGTNGYATGKQLKEALHGALTSLPPEQREVFLMREFQGLSFKEIAHIVEAPENTVKSRMRYALETLRKHLQAYR